MVSFLPGFAEGQAAAASFVFAPSGFTRISRRPDVMIWVELQKIGKHPQNGWLKMENPIKMDDLGGKPTIFGNPHLVRRQLKSCSWKKGHFTSSS